MELGLGVGHLYNYNHDRRASEDAVFALRELTRRANAKKLNQIERKRYQINEQSHAKGFGAHAKGSGARAEMRSRRQGE